MNSVCCGLLRLTLAVSGQRLKPAVLEGSGSLLRVALAILPVLLLAPTGLNNLAARGLHLNGPSLLRSGSAKLLLPLLTLFGTQSAHACTTCSPVEPDLTSDDVRETSAKLSLTDYNSTWYHKRTSPTTSSCSSAIASGATASLSNLTGGTQYTWEAYSDSSCATTALDDHTVSTLDLTATSMEQTTGDAEPRQLGTRLVVQVHHTNRWRM